jgi:hypothetical protein
MIQERRPDYKLDQASNGEIGSAQAAIEKHADGGECGHGRKPRQNAIRDMWLLVIQSKLLRPGAVDNLNNVA